MYSLDKDYALEAAMLHLNGLCMSFLHALHVPEQPLTCTVHVAEALVLRLVSEHDHFLHMYIHMTILC